MTACWPREGYVFGGGVAEVALIALSSARLPDPLPVSRIKHGMPDDGDGPTSVALVARDRADDPQWFVEQVVAPFADLIATDLGADVAAAALASAHAYVIEGGRARLRALKVGRTSGTETEVLDGVKEGEEMILYPGDRIKEGLRVTVVKI